MSTLRKYFKCHQLETYIFIILPLMWITISCFYTKSLISVLSDSVLELFRWSFFYGGKIIFFGLVPLYIYLYFKIVVEVARWISFRVFNDATKPTFKMKQFLFGFCYLFLALGLCNLIISLSLLQISHISSPANMIEASELYMSMDEIIFGVNPSLWIQRFSQIPFLSYFLIESYSKLCFFFSIVFLGTLLFDKKNFRKFILAFYIAPFLAIPFWYLLPAVTPNEMYRLNYFSLESVIPVQQQYEKNIKNTELIKYLAHVSKRDEGTIMVSTNPSMHVAWGGIITYYAIALWWPLGFIFIPWLILNMLSTIYTIQHYVVDLPPGILCAVLAITITNYLLKFEKKYYTGKYPAFYFIDAIQKDMRFLKTKLLKKRNDKRIVTNEERLLKN